MLVATFTWGNPSHLPIKHQSVATLIKDTTWVFPGREAESSEEKCLLPAGRSPGIATLYVTCSHLQRPVRLGVWAPFTGEVQVPQLAKWMEASAPDAERRWAVCRPLAKEVKAEPWGVSTPKLVKYKLILEH